MTYIDIGMVALYLAATLLIGILKGQGVKSLKEYAISKREFSLPVLVSTIAATLIGGGSSMGLATKAFVYGAPFFFIFLGRPFVNLFLAYVIAPRMQQFEGRISIADIMGQVYGKYGQVITGITALSRSLMGVTAQVTAIGFVFEYFLGVSFLIGVIVGCGIIIVYTSYGGIRAVAFTDVLQFCLLVSFIPMITNHTLAGMGGYVELFKTTHETHFVWPEDRKLQTYLMAFFIIEFIPMFDILVIQRFLMAKDTDLMQRSLKISAFLQVPITFFITAIGIAAYHLFPELNPDLALPHVISNLAPEGFKGFAAAGLMAIIMSSADSELNMAGVLLVNDIIVPLKKKPLTEKQELRIAKIFTAIMGVAGVVTALHLPDILGVGLIFIGFWAPIAVIPLYAAFFKIQATPRTFIASAIAGSVSFFIWDNYYQEAFPFVPSFLAGMIGNAIVFLLGHYQERRQFQKEVVLIQKDGSKIDPKTQEDLFDHHLTGAQRLYKKARSFFAPEFLDWIPINAFSVFTLALYTLPSFMWNVENLMGTGLMSFLKLIGGVACTMLILREEWLPTFKGSFPFVWHMILLFTLPFVLSVNALNAGLTYQVSFQLGVGLFLMSVLCTWERFLVFALVGIISGIGLFWALVPVSLIELTWEKGLFFTQSVIFSFLVGYVFARSRDKAVQSRVENYRSMAAQIAHELRTPLQSLNIAIHFLKQKILDKPDLKFLHADTEDVSRASESLSDRISFILGTLRGDRGAMKPLYCPARETLEQLIEQYPDFGASREDFKLKVDLKIPPNVKIFVDKTALSHVIHNLMKNSYEAMMSKGDKGILTISGQLEKNTLVVKINDTGCGIPKKLLQKIMMPFVTTKTTGTGVGLYFCKYILNKMNIEMSLTSTEGVETTVTLIFPVGK